MRGLCRGGVHGTLLGREHNHRSTREVGGWRRYGVVTSLLWPFWRTPRSPLVCTTANTTRSSAHAWETTSIGRPIAKVGYVRSLPILCGLLVLVVSCATAGTSAPRPVDVQAHRGGLGLTVESTLPAFARALELGVTTLEMDVAITADGRDVIPHARGTDSRRCRDTAPATPGDPLFPYVGRLVKDLTFAQVRTLDCG